eukprot:jgi/Bigna1/84205/fgenesh1_pg.126_\
MSGTRRESKTWKIIMVAKDTKKSLIGCCIIPHACEMDDECGDGVDKKQYTDERLGTAYNILSSMSLFIIMIFGIETVLHFFLNIRTYFCSFYNTIDFSVVWASITLEFMSFTGFSSGILISHSFLAILTRCDMVISQRSVVRQIDILERIGAGVFGQTYLASYKGNRVVVKIPHHGTGDLQELIAYIRMEPHPNVVRFYGITTKKEKLCPVTKYYNLASADKLLAKGLVNFRNPSWFFKIALDIAEGLRHHFPLRHLHDVLGVVHNDIRCANVFLEADISSGSASKITPQAVKAVIGDWGLMKRYGSSTTKARMRRIPWQIRW